MDKYKIKATNIIAETFKKNDVKFRVADFGTGEVLTSRYAVTAAPPFDVKVFTNPDNSGVAVCIYELIAGVPKEKRARVIEACNILNDKYRFAKFYFNNTNRDINMEYDIYEGIPDETLGETVFDAICYMLSILGKQYKLFIKAVYTDKNLERGLKVSGIKRLKLLWDIYKNG